MKKEIFSSKVLVYSMILTFILLLAYESLPGMGRFESKKESKPVVRVKKAGKTLTPAQKKRFDELLEEAKSLILNWEDYNAAIQRLSEAKNLAVTKQQESDVYFYLSLAFFKKNAEKSSKEFEDAVENILLVDYFRKLDRDICPPRYIEQFVLIKKEYGILRIVSNPSGADVYLNKSESSAGKTPLTIARKAGKVKVRVKLGRKKKEEGVEVIAGKETLTPMFDLTKKSRSLLYIIGGAVVAGGIGAAALLLSGGEPPPSVGKLQINSNPAGAQVFLDGIDQGIKTNCLLEDIKAGSHTIKLEREDYQNYEETVTVTAGKTETKNIDLNPHVITITSPKAGQQIKSKPGMEVKIKWEIDASSQSESHMLSKSFSNFNRNITSQMRRQALTFRSSAHALNVRGEELESNGPKRNIRMVSSALSGFNGVFVPVNGKITKDISKHIPGSPGPNINYRTRNVIKREDTIALMQMQRAGRQSRIGNPVTNKSISPTKSGQKAHTLGEIDVLFLDYIDIFLVDDRGTIQTIAEDIQVQGSKGEYSWEVGQKYPDGAYKIRIQSETEDPAVRGESGFFDIVRGEHTWEQVGSPITDEGTIEKTQRKWGHNPDTGKINGPYGLAVDNDFNIYVADTGNDRVVKIKSNPRGEYVTDWPSLHPHQIIFNKGFIYVAESDAFRVAKYSTDGDLKSPEFNTPGDSARGVAVDNNGNVYVAFYGFPDYTGGFLVFDSGGNRIARYPEGLLQPVNLAVNSQKIVYIADRNGNNIVYYDSNGKPIDSWQCQEYPLGIAIDRQDHVFVADRDARMVLEYTSQGEELARVGVPGTFKLPVAVAFDKKGYLYVLDAKFRMIKKFEKKWD